MKRKAIIIISSVCILLFLIISYVVGFLVYDGSVGSVQKIKDEDIVEVFSHREGRPLEKLKNYNYFAQTLNLYNF